jgi:hypothetical protein
MQILRSVNIAIMLVLLILSYNQVKAGTGILVGPIVAGINIGGNVLIFQDIGSNSVWEFSTPTRTYDFSTMNNLNWSPNGCKLLGLNTINQNWITLSIDDLVIDEINATTDINNVIWFTDSSVTYSNYNTQSNTTEVYSLNLENRFTEHLFSFEGNGTIISWITNTTLLYSKGANWFVWNLDSKVAENFSTQAFPPYGLPDGWSIFSSSLSPNYELRVQFFNPLWERRSDEDDEFLPDFRSPGMEIYDLATGETQYININDQFLQTLQWSPTSSKILIVTVGAELSIDDQSSGLYIYSLENETLRRVSDFAPHSNPEYGLYIPMWSPDEQWLTVRTELGFVAYNLANDRSVNLTERFSDTFMYVSWSPSISHSTAGCH